MHVWMDGGFPTYPRGPTLLLQGPITSQDQPEESPFAYIHCHLHHGTLSLWDVSHTWSEAREKGTE